MDDDDEIFKLFIEESLDLLNGIEEDLLLIEKQCEKADSDLINNVFRAVHTIKGGAGFFGLEKLKDLTHILENMLERVRTKDLVPTPKVIQTLLSSVDQVNEMLHYPRADYDITPNLELVSTILSDIDSLKLNESTSQGDADNGDNEEHINDTFLSREELDHLDSSLDKANEEMNKPISPDDSLTESTINTLGKDRSYNSENFEKDVETTFQRDFGKSESLRVNVKLLEDLMALAGELVLARNQLIQANSHTNLEMINSASHQIDMVTSHLQEAIMKTRMQPISTILGKYKRIVRDLSVSLGKDVDLKIEGETIEMDKTIIESINAPLTHIIRNSMDHGLETGKERKALGKDEKACISINALHEAGKVIIEIEDNGRGINPQEIGRHAVEKGLISENEMSGMSDRELINLIFKPGFSTAKSVTEFSGRGVGMDVVLNNLNKVGGIVDLSSKLGSGTKIKISLPLTLAIMPSLLVSISNSIYAIPQINLIQIIRISVDEISDKIMHVGNTLVVRSMDYLIPIARPCDFLESELITSLNIDSKNYGFDFPLDIVVVSSGEMRYGIIVDQTLESPEIVVKPLGADLKSLKIYAGATILGDGTIAPILDVAGILNQMKFNLVEKEEAISENENQGELHQLLIVNNGYDENFAIPLKNVVRIERVSADTVKYVGSSRTCEFRGKSIALFTVDDAADVDSLNIEGTLFVVMFTMFGRNVGMIVKEIVDSVELYLEFDEHTHRQPGILGSTFINNELTLLIDLFGIVAVKKPEWLEKLDIHLDGEGESEPYSILVVDDSKFFVNQIAGFITEAGYSVIQANDGVEALEQLRNEENNIHMVITDIEMPRMDGFQLTENIREDDLLRWLPVIAVTSIAGAEAERKGKEVGIDEYLIKLDREEILLHLRRLLQKNKKELAV